MDLVTLEPPWSVADVLDRLAPRTDEAVAGVSRARLHALAVQLPAALTRVIYLESWVGQLRPRLDLIVKIDPYDRDALADLARRAPEPELRAQPGWANAARFAREWAAPGSLLHDGIRAVWLEFDLDPTLAPDEALPSPRVFVDFTREAQCRASVEERLDLATEVICALSGSPAPGTRAEPVDPGPPHEGDRNLLASPLAETLGSLRACLAQLPGGATLAYLGVFARDGEPPIVRACMVGLAGNLAAYLGAIRWPGDVDALARRLLGPLARAQGEGVDPVGVLHLDLAPEVGPRIGLEYTFPRSGRPGGMRSTDAFLRQLVERGWCTSRNREGLRSWPMRWVELMPHDVWHSQVARQIAHVKITYAPGEPVVAKAYLRAAFELLTGGTLLRGALRRRFGSAGPGGEGARGDGDGALAPSDGGMPPSPAASSDDAAPRSLERSGVRAGAQVGTAVALAGRELTGETGMPRSTAHTEHTAHKEALEQILTRAAVDVEFRKALLVHPRKAILDGLGVRIPAKFRVKFIEREKDVDALIVLPDLQRHDCELDDDDLDGVSGGADPDPSDNW